MSAEGGAEGGSASTKRTKRKQKRGNAIRLALLAGDVAGLDRAVQEGARVDAQLEGGRTPLTLACDRLVMRGSAHALHAPSVLDGRASCG